MTDDTERRTTNDAASPKQSWIVPIIALALFALFVWLFLGGRPEPPTSGREHSTKSKVEEPPRDGVRP